MPLGGSLTSTSKPASEKGKTKNRAMLQKKWLLKMFFFLIVMKFRAVHLPISMPSIVTWIV